MPVLPDDTRGIVAPNELVRHVGFERYDVPAELDGLIDWFWSVRWDLRMGFTHRQRLVAHPAVNISVGIAPPPGESPPPGPYRLRTVVNGVTTDLTTRTLTGAGWNLAAKSTVGGFGAWVDDVSALNDDVVPIAGLISVDGDAICTKVGDRVATSGAQGGMASGVGVLADALTAALELCDPRRVRTARETAAVAAIAEQDRSVRNVGSLASYAGVTVRTLQRMFSSYAGVSPAWVIRRYRLIDAAELVRGGQVVDWSAVAVDLGYADQAHLTRDFTRTIGQSPAAYATSQRQAANSDT